MNFLAQPNPMRPRRQSTWQQVRLLAAACLTALLPLSAAAQSFEEPSTVFYGKIYGTGSQQAFLLSEGELQWTVLTGDGEKLILRSELFPLHDGEFSYRLDVPHAALAAGLNSDGSSIPLGSETSTHEHLEITVEGLAATIVGPSGAAFNTAQAMRAATYRLDLAVPLIPEDLDGDGLPDWWEDRYGVDDPDLDSDGDGLNNRDEFLAGYRPNHDDRAPTLRTTELRAFAGGTTIVNLQVDDADTDPGSIHYKLATLPANGQLVLRNAVAAPDNPDVVLQSGHTFSQQDVENGRLVFLHNNHSDGAGDVFEVTVSDGTAAAAPVVHSIEVNVYEPIRPLNLPPVPSTENLVADLGAMDGFSPVELPWLAGYWLGSVRGFIVGDLSWGVDGGSLRAPTAMMPDDQYYDTHSAWYGGEKPHLLLGSVSDDVLLGGKAGDILMPGNGDDRMTGDGGSDLFVFMQGNDGQYEITDFDPAESDRIDFSQVLNGTSLLLTDYLQFTQDSAGTLISIDADGDGGSYNDLSVRLSGTLLSQDDLHQLVEEKILITGDKQMPPRIELTVADAEASENGPDPATLLVRRTGSLLSSLSVQLQISGSAANGVDYQWIEPSVEMPAGVREVEIAVLPYIDTLTELDEVVQIRLAAGEGYSLGQPSQASITIADLAPLIAVEAIEPVAVKSPLTPGHIVITRSGVIDRSVFVRLRIGGSIANGTDIDALPAFVNLAAGETTALLTVTPKASAELTGNAEEVTVEILPDDTYRVGGADRTRVQVIEERQTLGGWMAVHHPESTLSPEQFATEKTESGLSQLAVYAFGLNAEDPLSDPEKLPRYDVSDGRVRVVLPRPAAVTDVEYRILVSPDLNGWSDGTDQFEETFPAELEGQSNVQCLLSRQPLEEQPIRFLRIQLNYQP